MTLPILLLTEKNHLNICNDRQSHVIVGDLFGSFRLIWFLDWNFLDLDLKRFIYVIFYRAISESKCCICVIAFLFILVTHNPFWRGANISLVFKKFGRSNGSSAQQARIACRTHSGATSLTSFSSGLYGGVDPAITFLIISERSSTKLIFFKAQ